MLGPKRYFGQTTGMCRLSTFGALTMVMLAASTIGAAADQIDGTWCSPAGQTLSIDGTKVVTPGGNSVVARYDRHHIDYPIPEGEQGAGDRFSAEQLNDEQIRVTILNEAQSKSGAPEIWTPCKPIS